MKTKLKKLIREPRFYLALAASAAAITLIVLIVSSFPPVGTEPFPTDPPYIPPEGGQSGPKLEENPISPEDFVYDGDYLTCLSVPSVLGIDVSYCQGQIDWFKVKEAGVKYAIIRAGYRGMTAGMLDEDDWVRINYEGATAAGISVGFYFFSQAISPEEAKEEAEFVLNIIREWTVQMPVVYDWEYGGKGTRTENMDARTLTDCAKAFCQTIEEAGFDAMVYFNESQAKDLMYLEELMDYRFWLAQYDHTMKYPYKVDMWQYGTAKVPGITGEVDVNLLFEYNKI